MRYLFLLMPFFALGQSFEVVDSPAYYYITVDSDTINQRYTKESKAILKAAELSLTSDNVVLLRPSANFTFNGDIQVDLSDIYARLDSLDFANELQGMAINDLYNDVIPQLQRQIAYVDSLNRRKIDVLQNRIDNLHSADNAQTTPPPPPASGNIIGDAISFDRSWSLVDGRYYFDDRFDTQRLVIALTEPLQVGREYTLDFETEGANPIFDVKDSEGNVLSGTFTAESNSETITVTAINSSGGTDFYIFNLNLE
jgi:hypothetical protein